MNEERTTTPPGPLPGPLSGQLPVRMRGPADMAEMLPYLLGFFPDDSIVAVGLQGAALQQGGVIRLDIPDDPAQWQPLAADTARLLIELSEQRDRRPEQVLLYLCRDPADGDSRALVARLGPLAKHLAEAFQAEGVTVKESLCVSGGRWWSFLCAGTGCCNPAGALIRSAHLPSPIAVAATFAGLAPRGSRKGIVAGLAPIGPPDDEAQREAIDRAGPGLLAELSGPGGRPAALERTGALLDEAVAEFQAGAKEIDPERAARLLVGLQDKLGRDRGAEYVESVELVAAQRLWRFLAQRCVPPFEHFAAAPLTLLAWTSWLADDTATARIVLARALDLDPDYTLAQLLYESLNGGLEPDQLLVSVRLERAGRQRPAQRRPGRPATGRAATGAPDDGASDDGTPDAGTPDRARPADTASDPAEPEPEPDPAESGGVPGAEPAPPPVGRQDRAGTETGGWRFPGCRRLSRHALRARRSRGRSPGTSVGPQGRDAAVGG